MIRYPISLQELEKRVQAAVPGWLEEAARRTERFRELGRYEEDESTWGEVKRVFMDLQREKCAYCERRLSGQRFGSVEHDVEHYRPKSTVRVWPARRIERERGLHYDFATGSDLPAGYYLLAYQLFNYAIACKTCNTSLKGSFFPIAAERLPGSLDPVELRAERPFLLYPLGELDEDPEEILTFNGINPVPKIREGHPMRRAIVTIDFFALDERGDLLCGRAETIRSLYLALLWKERADSPLGDLADRAVVSLLSSASEHASCARCFHDLYRRDPQRAAELAQIAQNYIDSRS